MATGMIGQSYTFQVLFLDQANNPIAANNPVINVYHFETDGSKTSLVGPGEPLIPAVPAELGRYTYTYTLPDTLIAGDVIYGLMQGVDPGLGITLIVEQTVDLTYQGLAGQTGGMRAHFINYYE